MTVTTTQASERAGMGSERAGKVPGVEASGRVFKAAEGASEITRRANKEAGRT